MLALRSIRLRPLALLAMLAAGVALAAAPASAAEPAAPRLLSAELADPSLTGTPVPFAVRAAGRGAPVTGMVVDFGGADGAFGLSSCGILDSTGRAPGAPFGPRSAVTLTASHAFTEAQPRSVALRLDSGSCDATGPSVAWPLTVTPNRAGEAPRPVLFGTPLDLAPNSPFPGLGLPELPGSPLDPGSPLPELPDVPVDRGSPLPQLPSSPLGARRLPGLAGGGDGGSAGTAQRRRRCRGANRRPGRGRASRRRAARRTICLINVERRRRGLRALRGNRRLGRAARAHARSMVRRRYFSHVQPSGAGLARRAARVGYISSRRRWTVGENLGFGQGRASTPRRLVTAWMRSSSHRRTMLLPRFRELGVGVVHGSPLRSRRRGITYAVNFGISRRARR